MKDHFLPCLLLSRFSATPAAGREALLYQFNVGGAHPSKEVAAKSLARIDGFYDHVLFPNLDAAGLHRKERAAAAVLAALERGDDPQIHAVEIAQFVTIQALRTQAFRVVAGDAFKRVIDVFLRRLERSAANGELQEALDRALQDTSLESVAALGIPRELAEDVLSKHSADTIRRLARENTCATVARLRLQWGDAQETDASIIQSQIKALHSMVGQSQQAGPFSNAHWTTLVSDGESFILGDACAVCVGRDGSSGWIYRYGPEWREVYMPIGCHTAVVGLHHEHRGAPSLSAAQLNQESAALSHKYLYAPTCTPRELALAATIGSKPPLMSHEEQVRIVEAFQLLL